MEYRGLKLDKFQQTAIEALDAGASVLVAAPTGTGKTIIADWIVEQALSEGREVIYTAPIKALSNQKFRDYVRLYGEEKVGLVTGDLVIRHSAPCRVMTTEVLRNMLLGGEKLPNLAAVILDEIHFLDDRDRGTVWEEVLIYLPEGVQIVGLSATLSNLTDFADWLDSVRDTLIVTVTETERAVPLEVSFASVDTGIARPKDYITQWRRRPKPVESRSSRGRHQRGRRGGKDRGRRPRRKTTHIDLFRMAHKEGLLPYLYFVFSRKDTEILARNLGNQVPHGLLSDEASDRMQAMLNERAPELGAALDPELRSLYEKGIAFHHAGLHVQLKALVEELYEQRLIEVLYCTSTFALGINMPARTVIFDGIKKYDGRTFSPLTGRQFMQKAGRAGRRGMDTVGHVLIRVDFEEYTEFAPSLDNYLADRVEPVRSSFNLSWNSVVSLLERHSPERCREIVEKSFLNWFLGKQAARHRDQARGQSSTKQERRLAKRAARDENRCWNEFSAKVGYLVGVGYLDEDHTFNAGAQVLRHLQMSEILVSELVLHGVLDDLDDDMLFGALCSLTNDLPRHAKANFRPAGDEKHLARLISEVRFSNLVQEAEEITGDQYPFDPDLLHLGRAWAKGDDLQVILLKLSAQTDISGDLITGFRRAKDLAGQLRDVWRNDLEQVQKLNRIIKKVSRDEVEVVG